MYMDMLAKIIEAILSPFNWFFHTSWKIKAAVAVAVIIAGFLISREIIPRQGDKYVLGKIQKQAITEMVTESGVVTTNGSANVYSPTNGIIDKVLVSNGESVSENKILFSVKSTATAQEEVAAYAAYQVAQAAVRQAENTYRGTLATVDRVHDDVKDHSKDESFLMKETRTDAEVANDNAYDALKAAQAKLLSAQVDYQATQNSTVTAPVAGKISNLSVVVGSRVSINNVLVPTSPVLVISGLGDPEIVVAIGESEINKIKTGQEVDIKLDAVANKFYKGTVKRFDDNGSITAGVVKFNVYVAIADHDDRIKPGMTADVDIVTNRLTDALTVPNTAIKPYQKGRAVRILGKNNKLEFIPVETGIRGKEFTQITGGLNEGQEIVVSLASEKTTTRKGLFEF